jgi:hypothetical protein
MYEIVLFSGGVYKFDLLVEHVEDVGGLLVQENRLQISRGTSFLSEEIRVMIIAPTNEISGIKSIAKDIKGEIEEIEIEKPLKDNLISALELYGVMCKTRDWLDMSTIQELSKFHYEKELVELKDNQDHYNAFEECLELMISLELIEKRESERELEYRVLKKVDEL